MSLCAHEDGTRAVKIRGKTPCIPEQQIFVTDINDSHASVISYLSIFWPYLCHSPWPNISSVNYTKKIGAAVAASGHKVHIQIHQDQFSLQALTLVPVKTLVKS